ncbi:MAG: hypothetical protein SNJ85_06765 [Cyanobacteriota bacterium]
MRWQAYRRSLKWLWIPLLLVLWLGLKACGSGGSPTLLLPAQSEVVTVAESEVPFSKSDGSAFTCIYPPGACPSPNLPPPSGLAEKWQVDYTLTWENQGQEYTNDFSVFGWHFQGLEILNTDYQRTADPQYWKVLTALYMLASAPGWISNANPCGVLRYYSLFGSFYTKVLSISITKTKVLDTAFCPEPTPTTNVWHLASILDVR